MYRTAHERMVADVRTAYDDLTYPGRDCGEYLPIEEGGARGKVRQHVTRVRGRDARA